ncbi:hypothetical protein Pst134EB_027307 [Puccinia striiformis f. sp. tritici]|nr:hypothetical protein Pst134EB_027307 [Puccinia striiformis f. sp. tritici]
MGEIVQLRGSRGIDFTDEQTDTLVRIMCVNLVRQHDQREVVTVDFDLLAVFLMQETDDQLNIRKIVTMLLKQFQSELAPPRLESEDESATAPPKTALQNQLLQAAEAVHETIKNFDAGLCTSEPFCIRYPTYGDVLKYSVSMQDKCKTLSKEKMVVLVDEAGICVGVGVPPVPKGPEKLYMQPIDTALIALDGVVLWLCLDDENSEGMNDLKIKIGEEQIDLAQLQGCGNSWKTESPAPILPYPVSENQQDIDAGARSEIRNEIRFFSKMSLWINKAFLPKSTEIAERAVEYLKSKGSCSLRENLCWEKNPIMPCYTISVNTGTQTLRDQENALLFDSTFFLGNHVGGEFLLPSLGVAYPGLHGYSFHGPLRILLHGSSKFYFPENSKEAPRRYSVMLSSQASSLASVARCSAYHEGNTAFSDNTYWLPVLPKYDPIFIHDFWHKHKSMTRKRSRKSKNTDGEVASDQKGAKKIKANG